MATIMRPQFARQACAAAAGRRFISSSVLNAASRSPVQAAVRSSFMKQQRVFPTATKVAAFHATKKTEILPPLPQRVVGTSNDPVPILPTSPSHGSYHWDFERVLAVALVPLTIAPFAAGSLTPSLDAALGAIVIIHSHVGFQSCIIDYFPKYRTPKTHRAFLWLLNAATGLTLYGLYEFETNDVGITEGIKRIWQA